MKFFVYTIIAVVAAAVIAGFFVVGSPQEERLRRFDEMRVQNLQFIQSEIIYFWQNKNHLPASLDDLRDDIRGISIPRDPQTGESYGYQTKGSANFELCANFARAGRFENAPASGIQKSVPAGIGYSPGGYGNWQHDAGRVCFERTIDRDIYPPIRKE
ncbi:MAG: hypothetical protein U1C57_00945 [Candidatus Doudnabacteria bacterium]|nr:hypothetical protein [bacterium]MDZ4243651.1 hypothetical protein [Candidatus Doudnabacteria bacterium]